MESVHVYFGWIGGATEVMYTGKDRGIAGCSPC